MVSDSLVVTWRNLKRIPRIPELAVLVQTLAFAAATAAIGVVDDMQKGLIDRFRSLPMARSAFITGRTVSDVQSGQRDHGGPARAVAQPQPVRDEQLPLRAPGADDPGVDRGIRGRVRPARRTPLPRHLALIGLSRFRARNCVDDASPFARCRACSCRSPAPSRPGGRTWRRRREPLGAGSAQNASWTAVVADVDVAAPHGVGESVGSARHVPDGGSPATRRTTRFRRARQVGAGRPAERM